MEKPEISNLEESQLAGSAIKFLRNGGTAYNKKYLLWAANSHDPSMKKYRKAANSLLQKIRNLEKISKENKKKNGVHKPEQENSKNDNINL